MGDRPHQAAGIEIAEFPGGLMVRQAGPPRLHQLNNTASIVLGLCDGRRTVAEIAGTLAETFTLDVPPLAEAATCVAELRRAGVLAANQPGDPFGFFAAIWCLNLDERPDRWENMCRRFERLGLDKQVERFPALAVPRNRRIGCTSSWRLMVAQARERKLRNFLGFEDDAIFLDTTLEVVTRAVSELDGLDWDLLYLGGAAWHPPADIPGHLALQSPRRLTCTHALAVNHTAYDRLLADIAAADGIEEWMTAHRAIDQFLAKQVTAGRYRAYVLNPRVATQIELTGPGGLDGALRDRYTIR
jgi:GR25 family glycosyltransferase involved in LPS biosynthesis